MNSSPSFDSNSSLGILGSTKSKADRIVQERVPTHRTAMNRAKRTVVLLFACTLTTAFAHRPLNTTIEGALLLDETELKYEIKIAHFLLPPTKDCTANALTPDSNALRLSIGQYIAQKHPVTIDGIRVPPTIGNLKLTPVEEGIYVNTPTNYIRVEFSAAYAINMPPRQISLVWQLYPFAPPEGWGDLVDADQDPSEIIQTLTTEGEVDFVFFSPDEPEFVWHSTRAGTPPSPSPAPGLPQLAIPILSLMLIALAGAYLGSPAYRRRSLRVRLCLTGALLVTAYLSSHLLVMRIQNPLRRITMPSDPQALSLFSALHANIYRAFDYTSEEDIYDVLSQSVDGDLLDDLYTKIHKSLILRYKGGAVCKISKVDILEAKVIEKRRGRNALEHQIIIDSHWQVQGIVEHWEHLHRRVNAYEARFTLSARSGSWKLCKMDITRQERVTAEDRPLGSKSEIGKPET
jgi:hypothetical protein